MASERDEILASLQLELRDLLATLNRLYHPVYPADEDRVKVLEVQVADLRRAITERREELASA